MDIVSRFGRMYLRSILLEFSVCARDIFFIVLNNSALLHRREEEAYNEMIKGEAARMTARGPHPRVRCWLLSYPFHCQRPIPPKFANCQISCFFVPPSPPPPKKRWLEFLSSDFFAVRTKKKDSIWMKVQQSVRHTCFQWERDVQFVRISE